MIDQKTVRKLIRLAQAEAEKAIKNGNPPFGSVLTDLNGKVIGSRSQYPEPNQRPNGACRNKFIKNGGTKNEKSLLGRILCIWKCRALLNVCFSVY